MSGRIILVVRDLPSGTVTLLFTDVEGSTRLLLEAGDLYAGALADHRRRVRDAVARHGGVEVDTQGDAFFFVFREAPESVVAAEEAQRALAGGPVRVRIGIHTGEPQLTEEGYVGIDVHKAARICAAAHGGQVVFSERTRALLDEPVGITALGLHRLKDLGRPEKLFQLAAQAFPPLRSLNATNLPAQPSPLVGRERELGEVKLLLREHRLVTLTGTGGSGKTRLALQVAADLTDEFEDGTVWVPLAAVTDPELVLPAIAATLGAKARLAEHIDEKRMLLLLDNLEQVLGCVPALAGLLESCPNLKLLVTSRAILRLAAEREYEVASLPDADAVALFRERAVQSKPLEAVVDICRRLDGLPLAIELAAARTRTLPPMQLLERLEHRLSLLTGGLRDAPERQRTLKATIEWSYDLLSAQYRQLFARLAVFAGSFNVEAAQSVSGADLDSLETLLEQSLLRRTEAGRFFYLETIREFALERLDESAEAAQIGRRHAEHFLALAESANLSGEAEGEQDHAKVTRDQDNLRAAIDWALSVGERTLAVKLAVAVENFWVVNDPFEGMRRFSALLDGALPDELCARALRAYGGSSDAAGEHAQAERLYEQSLDLFKALSSEHGIAVLAFRLGLSAMRRGDNERARALVEESLALHRKIGSKRGEAQALGALGRVELGDGHLDRAAELLQESATEAAEIGRHWWRAGVLNDLARVEILRGRPAEAERWAQKALELFSRISDRGQSLVALAYVAFATAEQGFLERAGRLWGAIEAEAERRPLVDWDRLRDQAAERFRPHAEPEFEHGRAEGTSLSLEQVVEEALERAELDLAAREPMA
jgi:predicted ATPase/class 3 adenylate cyclase